MPRIPCRRRSPDQLAGRRPRQGTRWAIDSLVETFNKDPDVALAVATLIAANATVAPLQLFSATAPKDQATTDLLFHSTVPARRLAAPGGPCGRRAVQFGEAFALAVIGGTVIGRA